MSRQTQPKHKFKLFKKSEIKHTTQIAPHRIGIPGLREVKEALHTIKNARERKHFDGCEQDKEERKKNRHKNDEIKIIIILFEQLRFTYHYLLGWFSIVFAERLLCRAFLVVITRARRPKSLSLLLSSSSLSLSSLLPLARLLAHDCSSNVIACCANTSNEYPNPTVFFLLFSEYYRILAKGFVRSF